MTARSATAISGAPPRAGRDSKELLLALSTRGHKYDHVFAPLRAPEGAAATETDQRPLPVGRPAFLARAVVGLRLEWGKAMSVMYKGDGLDCGYRLDLLVERSVIVERNVVEQLSPIHAAQLLTYLKLSGHHVGPFINFNVR